MPTSDAHTINTQTDGSEIVTDFLG